MLALWRFLGDDCAGTSGTATPPVGTVAAAALVRLRATRDAHARAVKNGVFFSLLFSFPRIRALAVETRSTRFRTFTVFSPCKERALQVAGFAREREAQERDAASAIAVSCFVLNPYLVSSLEFWTMESVLRSLPETRDSIELSLDPMLSRAGARRPRSRLPPPRARAHAEFFLLFPKETHTESHFFSFASRETRILRVSFLFATCFGLGCGCEIQHEGRVRFERERERERERDQKSSREFFFYHRTLNRLCRPYFVSRESTATFRGNHPFGRSRVF